MVDSFRALCGELLRAWEKGDDISGAMNRARALPLPTSEAPSDVD